MSRKPPTDTFTRFTSTTPSHASNVTPTPTSTPLGSLKAKQPSPPGETPQQRVARLRAQHDSQKASAISSTDRVLARGRRFADIFHRATAYTLIGFSAVAVVVASYGMVSLVSHNRTQKRAWIEREMDKLEDARAQFLRGQASAEQLHLLEQERAGEVLVQRFEEEKRRRKWSTKIKGFLGMGEDTGDKGEGETLRERGERIRAEMDLSQSVGGGAGGVEGTVTSQQQPQATQRFKMGNTELELRPAAVSESAVAGVGLDEKGRPVPIGKMEQRVVQQQTQIQQSVGIPHPGQTRRGGPLDQLAGNISDGVSSTGSSIWSSIFGGASKS